MPSLQKMLQDYFSDAQFLCTIPPDEVIATGAAIQVRVATAYVIIGSVYQSVKQVQSHHHVN